MGMHLNYCHTKLGSLQIPTDRKMLGIDALQGAKSILAVDSAARIRHRQVDCCVALGIALLDHSRHIAAWHVG